MAAAAATAPPPPAIASIRLTTYNSEVYEPAEDSFLLVDTLLAQLPRWAAAGTPPPAWCAALCSRSLTVSPCPSFHTAGSSRSNTQ